MADITENDSLQLLSKRWNHLPNLFLQADVFLQWIATWLTDPYQVQKFIELSEKYGLHAEFFPRIVNEDPIFFNDIVATALRKIADHNIFNVSESMSPEDFAHSIIEADDLLSLALAFQSKNAVIMLSLAAISNIRHDYSRALKLFNEGLPLLREEMTTCRKFEAWWSQQYNEELASIDEAIPPETIMDYEQMRDECLIHLRQKNKY